MNKIEILCCASCGASLSPKDMKCEFCDNENIIKKELSTNKLSAILSKQYLSNDALQLDNFIKALLHLNLKNYSIAQKLLEKEIEKNPANADAYFYCSITIMSGSRIRALPYSGIKKIVECLFTAIQLEENAKFYFLLAIVNYDFFDGNGMLLPVPNYITLLEKTVELKLERDDFEFLQSINLIPEYALFKLYINY